jgi:hypothetical protein
MMSDNSNKYFQIGQLRLTECRLADTSADKPQPKVPVYVAPDDFMGTRTAMFGKTRLGKSNIVKLIAQSLIETAAGDGQPPVVRTDKRLSSTDKKKTVGQIIFDIEGEYANDNPQDDNSSLRSAYPEKCQVYAYTLKPGRADQDKLLRINFYEHPDTSHKILGDLLKIQKRTSIYVNAFLDVKIPSREAIEGEEVVSMGQIKRNIRKILMYWAILHKAGFDIDETKLSRMSASDDKNAGKFNPGFRKDLREEMYKGETPSPVIDTLDELQREFEVLAEFRQTPEIKVKKRS